MLAMDMLAMDMRTTEFAPAQPISPPAADPPRSSTYGPPQFARAAQMGGFAGDRFLPQADGTLRCPAGSPLYLQERRPERDGAVRVLYAARIGHCRQCLGYGTATKRPRRVSAVLRPIAPSSVLSPGESP